MTDMQYVAPTTLEEAIGAFAAAGSAARILAGGTDLLVQMRSGVVRPGVIVDIKKIAEMTAIKEIAGGGFWIGAAVSGAVLCEHSKLSKVWPGVVEATNLIGSTQIQGRATIAGNLCNASPAADSAVRSVSCSARERTRSRERRHDPGRSSAPWITLTVRAMTATLRVRQVERSYILFKRKEFMNCLTLSSALTERAMRALYGLSLFTDILFIQMNAALFPSSRK